MPNPGRVRIEYSSATQVGSLHNETGTSAGIWGQITTFVSEADRAARILGNTIELGWPGVLSVIREFSGLQVSLNFRFAAADSAKPLVQRFVQEYSSVVRGAAADPVTEAEARRRLVDAGWDFDKREPRPYQWVALIRLMQREHGANFSVPGAGKTSVTLALHLLLRQQMPTLLVVAPRNAFPAWRDEVMQECMRADLVPDEEPTFDVIGPNTDVAALHHAGRRRFIISYDQLIRVEATVAAFLSSTPVHLVIDESHRMKAGYGSQRGTTLLRLSTLAARRDILSGTPMPQGAGDLQSQLDFLWPGVGLGDRLYRGERPRQVLGDLYVRTRKSDLNLPARQSHFVDVPMKPAQRAFYAVVRDEVRRQASELRRNASEILTARRSVVRLLQISANPVSAIAAMTGAGAAGDRALYRAVIEEGPSAKVAEAERLARQLVAAGNKVLLWSIFTDTIDELSASLADLNPVVIRGGVVTGDIEDIDTREGRIHRFKSDALCRVMVANPAAASEGMSLHLACHHAIYVDRSFNATHFLQSIDRIHRLGLPLDVVTHVHILRSTVPPGIGSIDRSVSRRLAQKIRNLHDLLDDPDLLQVAVEEETSGDMVDYGIDAADIDDLIKELEGRAEGVDDELA